MERHTLCPQKTKNNANMSRNISVLSREDLFLSRLFTWHKGCRAFASHSVTTHWILPCFFALKRGKEGVLYEVEVGLNRWAGVFPDQGFRAAGQRA